MDTPTVEVDMEGYRRKAGISLLELERVTGIPRTTLRRKMEQPGRFTFDEFRSVASALNIPRSAVEVIL